MKEAMLFWLAFVALSEIVAERLFQAHLLDLIHYLILKLI